jgi:exodeoxyribonuclease V alpha subunit
LIEKNSHALGLTNGDVGIALGKPGDLLASLGLFQSAGAGPVLFPLASLPTFSPAFGLTIHKSQGSEWDTVAIELPSAGVSGLLTRNLLYTALTRASRSVHLLGDPAVLETLLKPAPGSASAV